MVGHVAFIRARDFNALLARSVLRSVMVLLVLFIVHVFTSGKYPQL